jgi:SnoaL-like domain
MSRRGSGRRDTVKGPRATMHALRDERGRFTDLTKKGRSLARDRKRRAKTKVKPGTATGATGRREERPGGRRGRRELRALALGLYEAMSTGDGERAAACFSLAPDAVFIGTEADDVYTDPAAHRRAVRAYWDGRTDRWSAGALHVVVAGEVGWVVDRPRLGGNLELRLTLVCRREGDAWKVVHAHTSTGDHGGPARG